MNVTFSALISKSFPNSPKLILLYNLLAANRLCSITARSKIDDPEKKGKKLRPRLKISKTAMVPSEKKRKGNEWEIPLKKMNGKYGIHSQIFSPYRQ